MKPARTNEIIRRAKTDAVMQSKHSFPVHCPYLLVAEAATWRYHFDLALAALKAPA